MDDTLARQGSPVRLPDNYHAVIIGAAGAIGSACVQVFADAGAIVTAIDRSIGRIDEVLRDTGVAYEAVAMDVTDGNAVSRKADNIASRRAVDGVIYAPGLAITANVANMCLAAYRAVMAVNLDGAVYVSQGFVRSMIARKRPGSFVFLTSVAGLRGEAGASAYCASKFGLMGFVESFAAELTDKNVRANAVAPGNVDSPLLRQVARDIAEHTHADADEIYGGMSRVGAAQRLVEPREVAETCLWLASPAASGITGATIRVDAGGMLERP